MMKYNKNMIIGLVVVIIAVLIVFSLKNDDSVTPQTLSTAGQVKELEGVKITVLQDGTGPEAVVGDTISINYSSMFTDGRVFDSSTDPSFEHVKPFSFTLGSGQVIKGWDTGIVGMKVGEKRKLEVAPEYAYGEKGIINILPPNTPVDFEIELVSIGTE